MIRKKHIAVLFVTFCAFAAAGSAGAAGLVTTADRALLREMNSTRAAHGLRPLRLDSTLQRAARSHSLAMMRRDFFSHGAFAQRLARFGVRGPKIGENLAWGVGTRARARAVVRQWLQSPGHRRNLLRPGFRRVGVSSVAGNFSGYRGARVVTADFAGT